MTWRRGTATAAAAVAATAAGFGVGWAAKPAPEAMLEPLRPAVIPAPIDRVAWCGSIFQLLLEDGRLYAMQLVRGGGGAPRMIELKPGDERCEFPVDTRA